MPTNDFIGFASSGSANIASQADYAAAAEQGIGMQSGPASSKLANKVWRQGANMAAALGRIAAARGYDALDNGDLNALQSAIDDTISVGTFNKVFFSQTSGSYTAPRTGVYRIMLKGGGGGGGYAGSTFQGGAGGEGGSLTFYTTLTKSSIYSYTIGAGGSGGIGASSTAATSGGNTTFNSGAYSAEGGAFGTNGGSAGGAGGQNFTVPAGVTAIVTRGAPGQSGASLSAPSDAPNGGGQGGGYRAVRSGNGHRTGIYGGGGQGGQSASYPDGGSGGTGFILIEYAG